MLNFIAIAGRLTKDPELRYTGSNTPVASFTLAVDRDYDRTETDFVSCVAWKQTAEFVDRNFRKGQQMILKGRLQSREWQDKEGKNRVSWEAVAESVYFCGDKKSSDAATSPMLVEVDDDGEIPFD